MSEHSRTSGSSHRRGVVRRPDSACPGSEVATGLGAGGLEADRTDPGAVARAAARIEGHIRSGGDAGDLLGPADGPWDATILVEAFRVCRASLIEQARETPGESARALELHARLDRLWMALADRRLERERHRQSRFLSEAAHDIRSPLHSILFLADALIEHRSGRLNDLQARQLGVLYGATLSLVGLVNDLLDASSADDDIGPVALAPFSPVEVLDQVRRMVDPLCLSREIAVVCEVEAPGRRVGDATVLTRLLGNLLSNAVQASEAGDRVEVRLEGDPDALELSVRNRAHHTDVEAIGEALDGRARERRRRTDAGGWQRGLGLEICARLIERAGGAVRVQADSGAVEVIVRLPFEIEGA